jgi:hypothetical protein
MRKLEYKEMPYISENLNQQSINKQKASYLPLIIRNVKLKIQIQKLYILIQKTAKGSYFIILVFRKKPQLDCIIIL